MSSITTLNCWFFSSPSSSLQVQGFLRVELPMKENKRKRGTGFIWLYKALWLPGNLCKGRIPLGLHGKSSWDKGFCVHSTRDTHGSHLFLLQLNPINLKPMVPNYQDPIIIRIETLNRINIHTMYIKKRSYYSIIQGTSTIIKNNQAPKYSNPQLGFRVLH